MAEYKLTNKAVEDLSKIWDYTFEVWSENQADKYYDELKLTVLLEIKLKPYISYG